MGKNLSSCDGNLKKEKKIDFCKKKENIICSLSEVEFFLCNCSKALKCGKIISFFKH